MPAEINDAVNQNRDDAEHRSKSAAAIKPVFRFEPRVNFPRDRKAEHQSQQDRDDTAVCGKLQIIVVRLP